MNADLLLASKKRIGAGSVRSMRFVLLRSGNGNQYPSIEEVDIRNSANVNVARLSGNQGSASSTYTAGGVSYSPNGPFDGIYPGSQINQWCPVINNVSNTGRTCWWAIRFSELVDVAEISMVATASLNRVPIDMDIEISQDGTTYQILAPLRNLSGWTSGMKKIY